MFLYTTSMISFSNTNEAKNTAKDHECLFQLAKLYYLGSKSIWRQGCSRRYMYQIIIMSSGVWGGAL